MHNTRSDMADSPNLSNVIYMYFRVQSPTAYRYQGDPGLLYKALHCLSDPSIIMNSGMYYFKSGLTAGCGFSRIILYLAKNVKVGAFQRKSYMADPASLSNMTCICQVQGPIAYRNWPRSKVYIYIYIYIHTTRLVNRTHRHYQPQSIFILGLAPQSHIAYWRNPGLIHNTHHDMLDPMMFIGPIYKI